MLNNLTLLFVLIHDILPPKDKFANFNGNSVSALIEKLLTSWSPLFIAEYKEFELN